MTKTTYTADTTEHDDYEDVWRDFDISRETKKEVKEQRCCDNFYHVELEGCIVCINCGIVQRVGIIVNTPEFCEVGQGYHTKTSAFFPKSSGSTKMSGNSKLSRIQNWNSMPYDERVLWEVSNLLKIKLQDHCQQRIIDCSLMNFKNLDAKKDENGKKEIHRGKIRDGLIASCVYFACKTSFSYKTPEEISKIMDIDITTLNKCTKIYTRIMCQQQETSEPVDFVDTYYSSIGNNKISYKIQCTTKKICKVVQELGILDGTIPQNITAGCILFTSNEMALGIQPKLFKDLFSISLNTLKKITTVITNNKNSIYKNILAKEIT